MLVATCASLYVGVDLSLSLNGKIYFVLFYKTALLTKFRRPNFLTPLISHDLEFQRNQFNQ